MVQFGFNELAVVPVRREPSDKAEMATQLLFGDILEIVGQTGPWLQIKNFYDGYEGWIDVKQCRGLDEMEFRRLTAAPVSVNRGLNGDTVLVDGQTIRLPAGCSFYDIKSQTVKIGETEYLLEGKTYPFAFSGPADLLKTAYGYLSCPYLWGGKTYLGLDCSGFTQVVYKQHGVRLLRDAAQQSTQGEMINMISEGLPSDLVFFDNNDGRIVHTGILLDQQRVLHCSGKVRIDKIDHQGIFNRDLNKYTHSLRLIRRVVGR